MQSKVFFMLVAAISTMLVIFTGCSQAPLTNKTLTNPTINNGTPGTPTINGGMANAPTGRTATYVIAASNSSVTDKAQADAVCNGTADDLKIQAAVNSLTSGGTIHFDAGIYNITATITLPTGLPFYFEGSGMPSWSFPFRETKFSTPNDGTQLRGSLDFNTKGDKSEALIERIGKTQAGILSITNMAIMPAWRTESGGTITDVYSVIDEYSPIVLEDNIMLIPWGWSEAGCPLPTTCTTAFQFGEYLTAAGIGGGSICHIGNIIIAGLSLGCEITGFDNGTIDNLDMVYLTKGIMMDCIWSNHITELHSYANIDYTVNFKNTVGRDNVIDDMQIEQLVAPSFNYSILLSPNTHLTVRTVYNWHMTYANRITTLTSNDNNLEDTCLCFNLGDCGILQSLPLNKSNTTPFGDTISTPFGTLSNIRGNSPGIGLSNGKGSYSATPISGSTYTANKPVDVTIDGQNITITTKDALGNIIDNNVTSLVHRLLLPDYTINVTYQNTPPNVTVVNAVIGYGGTTATPQANVNYVVNYYGVFITLSGGTGISVTTYDASNNVMDSGLSTLTRYALQPGQIINLGNFNVAPTILFVVRQ